MEKGLTISPYEIVGSLLCMASNNGQKVFERSAGALRGEVRHGLVPERVEPDLCLS